MAIERGDGALVLSMNDVGYATCNVESPWTDRESGGGATEPWPHGNRLPGPVRRLLLTSTEFNGRYVSVSGRVRRLVLGHGDGHATAVRGAFGLMMSGARLKAGNVPGLVSYDAHGTEINRRPLFPADDERSPAMRARVGADLQKVDQWLPTRREVGTVATRRRLAAVLSWSALAWQPRPVSGSTPDGRRARDHGAGLAGWRPEWLSPGTAAG